MLLAKDLIKDTIPSLKTSDTGQKALKWMDEFRVSHLPIVNNVELLGLVSEEDILNMNAPETPLGDHKLFLQKVFVGQQQHVYDVIRQITKLNVSVLPVLSAEQEYVGIITLPDIIKAIASVASIQDPGSIVILELGAHSYSLSEIAHVVESNDTQILSSYITSLAGAEKIELTLKLNRVDLSRVLAAFYRYNYNVLASFQEHEILDDLKNRYDSLMNYLNI